MVAPVFHKIVQGDTLEFEIRIVGDVVSEATVTFATSAGMSAGAFSSAEADTDTLTITAADTSGFSAGTHELRIKLAWDDGTDDTLIHLVHVTEAF